MIAPGVEQSVFAISARANHLAFVRGVLDASEGLGVICGEAGGEVWVVTPHSRREELRELLVDLSGELGFTFDERRQTENVALGRIDGIE
ncbi:MAG TPA: hypothetical protein VLC09_18000 [Polyangiaceae bacterium]|nr:hypothetical protein [Polyangiaceae bacterium]